MTSGTYRDALYRWLERCDIRDEHGEPVHLTPHQWRHTLGTRLKMGRIAFDASFGSPREHGCWACGERAPGQPAPTRMATGRQRPAGDGDGGRGDALARTAIITRPDLLARRWLPPCPWPEHVQHRSAAALAIHPVAAGCIGCLTGGAAASGAGPSRYLGSCEPRQGS